VADQPQKNTVWRIFIWLFEAIAAVILLLDAIARPLYRPLLDWIAAREIMHRFVALVAPLPRFAILILFGVPFVIAEPLKVFALYLVARGLVITGVLLLIFSYLVTFLIVERIYEAGRDKLLTYRWFAWAMTQIARVRDILLAIKARITARARAWLGVTAPSNKEPEI
jgi:hypothetical protein